MSDPQLPVPRDAGAKASPVPSADALDALKEIVAAACEYGRLRQEEQPSEQPYRA